MKSGILKLMLLSIPLVPLIAQAADDSGTPEKQTWKIEKKPSATFDSGETEPEGTGAKLRSDQQIKDDASTPAAYSATEPTAPTASPIEYEPGVTPPPRSAKKTKKSSSKATAQSNRTYRTSIETAYRPAALESGIDTEPKNAAAVTATPTVAPATSAKEPVASSSLASTTETAAPSTSRMEFESDIPSPPRSVKKPKKNSKTYRTSIETAYRPAAFESATVVEAPLTFLALDAKAHWKIHSGERISEVMSRWTKAIGWQLTWEPEDLIALADLDLEDTFTGATTKVIDALNRNGTDMQAKFYASNHMLRITVRK